MAVLVLLAAFFFLSVVVVGTVHAVRRVFGVFRALGSLGGGIADALARVTESAGGVAYSAAEVPERSEAVSRELERLAESRARLRVLVRTAGDLRTALFGLRATALGK